MYKRLTIILCAVGYGLCTFSQQPPLVYQQEHTGSHFAAPEMPGFDQLTECHELPDPLA